MFPSGAFAALFSIAITAANQDFQFTDSCQSYSSEKYLYTFCDEVKGYANSRKYCQKYVDKNSDLVIFPDESEFKFVLSKMRQRADEASRQSNATAAVDYSSLKVFIGAYQRRRGAEELKKAGKTIYDEAHRSGEYYWHTGERIEPNNNKTYWQSLKKWLQPEAEADTEKLLDDKYFLLNAANETRSGGIMILDANAEKDDQSAALLCQTDLDLTSKKAERSMQSAILSQHLIIIIAALGAALLVLLVIIIVCVVVTRKNRQKKQFQKVSTQETA